jgi:hypothetical protein
MKICLTGDLHHASLRTGNQLHADRSEIDIAADYTRRLAEAGVNVTYFVSGRAMEEEWTSLRAICENPRVEIGGHNYACLSPALPHRIYKKVFGTYNGPAPVQRRDCLRTIAAIERRTGRRIRAFRNHMYMHGRGTETVLASCGIEVCSDGVRAASMGPEAHPSGLHNLPINVIPDHEHLYHAERTPEWVDAWIRRHGFEDDFGSRSYHVEEWTDLVISQLHANAERGAISTVLIHPITLYLCDRFRAFGRILDVLAGAQTLHVSETLLSTAAPARAA